MAKALNMVLKNYGVDMATGAVQTKPMNAVGTNRVNPITNKNFMSNLTENDYIKGAREWALKNGESPLVKQTKNGGSVPIMRQGRIWNERDNFHKDLKAGKQATEKDITTLEQKRDLALKGANTAEDKERITSDYAEAILGARKQKSDIQTRMLTNRIGQVWDHTKRLGQWTQEGPLTDRLIKTGAVAGTWMGANAIGRGMSGGGMTYNNDGRRDIAGIPFM